MSTGKTTTSSVIPEISEWFTRFAALNTILQNSDFLYGLDRPKYWAPEVKSIASESFEIKVLPILEAESPDISVTLVALQENDPWLVDFELKDVGFRKSYETFLKEPRRMATTLLYYVELVYCEIFKTNWRNRTGYERKTLLETWQEIRNIPHDVYGKHNIQEGSTKLENSLAHYAMVLKGMDGQRRWSNIRRRVEEFAKLAKCSIRSDVKDNLFSYVNAIYQKSLETASTDQEAALKARIAILTEENRKQTQKLREQDRIVSCLTFRHILERLPVHRTKNEANNWTEFWEQAVKEANKPNSDTPISRIIRAHGVYDQGPENPANVTQIKKVGSMLYNTLSTNIHHFTADYELNRDQWDTLPRKILEAIVPEKKDGTVNWDEERARFIPPPPLPQPALGLPPHST